MPTQDSKVMQVDEAVRRFVQPGDVLSLAFGDARPNALIREIVRAFKGTDPQFTVVATGLLSSQQALVGAGLVTRLLTSFAGENFPAPQPSPVIRRALESGRLTIEDWSVYTLSARLAAAALNVPFFPVRSFADDSMSGRPDSATRAVVSDPFTGGNVTVVPRLDPDVCLVHGVLADADGNVVTQGPLGEREWGALAATRGAVVTVERIVSTRELRRFNQLVRIPAAAVLAVCEMPGGSHPYGVYSGGLLDVQGYDEDAAYMLELREAMKSESAFDAWIDDWLAAPWPSPSTKVGPALRTHPDGYSAAEMMVVAAARHLRRRCEATDPAFLLAGIGQANLAAWLAHTELAGEPSGRRVELLAEMGMVGYEPQPGDSYIFANQNKPSATQLTDTMAVLGSYVGHPRMRTIAAVGAGQVDSQGNINSTVGFDGRYLTGSGGVNDIASVAAELVVILKQSASRLVDEAAVVTAPGRAVRAIVTDRAIYERGERGFVPIALLRGAEQAGVPMSVLLDGVKDTCGWTDVEWPLDLPVEPAPSPEELATLRAFDPQRYFLR